MGCNDSIVEMFIYCSSLEVLRKCIRFNNTNDFVCMTHGVAEHLHWNKGLYLTLAERQRCEGVIKQ